MKICCTTGVSPLGAIAVCCLSLAIPVVSTRAQTPITSSGLNTQVSAPVALPSGQTQYNITGGTRPGGGTNLFHSFGDFNVPNNNIANFLNDSGLATSNILGRVTGGNISNIFGTIQTTGFGNANLFLMNPAGFLFGPNATVNVGGMVAFTSADYLRLADGVRFNATPNATADALLTPSPVAAFGFLGSNPGAITVQGSQFTVTEGTGISLVGGNITIQSGTLDNGTVQPARLSAPNGQIQLASATSPGEFDAATLQPLPNADSASFTSLGNVSIGQDAHIDTAGTTGGTIMIRGGQLLVTGGATVTSAASADPPAPAGSVTINGAGVQMTGSDVVLNGTNVSVTGSKVTATNLDGSGGTISIRAGSPAQPGNVTVAQNALLNASGTSGGSITIRGGKLTIADATLSANTGNSNGAPVAVDIDLAGDLTISDTRAISAITATTSGAGNAGEVQIKSANMQATSTDPNLALFALIDTHSSGDGKAGNVSITTGNLTVTGPAPTWYFVDSGPQGSGHGGDVTITASNHIELDGTYISTGTQNAELLGLAPSTSAGNLTITADSLQTKNVLLDTHATTVFEETQSGGDITLNIRDINMVNTQIGASGVGRGGAITINADRFITDNTLIQSFNILAPGGGISFTGRILELTNGSNWSTSTFGDFKAGDILVNATDHVSLIGITGELGRFNPSGLFSNSFGGGGTQGAAGNIVVTTPRLTMQEGRINTSTATSGAGGNVTINASVIEMSGEFPNPDFGGFFGITNIHPSGIFTQTVGSDFCAGPCGNAGNVNITTGSLVMGAGSQINSGTTNTGRGGDITIHATDQISMSGTLSDGSPVGIFSRTIGTDPGSGAGGNITLTAGQSVTISNGASVSASSTGPGASGEVVVGSLASPAQSILIDGAGSGIFTNTESTGTGGDIHLFANSVTLQNGGTLSAATSGSAASATGGTITVSAEHVTLNTHGVITADTNGIAPAGVLEINTGSLAVNSGSQIRSTSGIKQPLVTSSAVASPLTGGTITIQGRTGAGSQADTVTIDGIGSGLFTGTAGLRPGGDIHIAASGSVSMTNGATMSASSTGQIEHPGNAGNINVTAMNGFTMQNSTITTQAGKGAGGGDVKITTSPEATVYLQDSTISASVADGHGGGGNISIDPQFVILQNSKILAQAAQGQGGAISITANLFLSDANSIVNADSGSGFNGTVTIQSPNAPASGKIIPLSQKPLIATTLLSQRCAALARGELSSLTVAGRDSLPTEPGSWLSSPLALTGPYSGPALTEGGTHTSLNNPEEETPLLSLRQIAPPGFLTRTFAVDASAGCSS